MCGIFGYTGNKEALGIILGGLEQLEYRGYDSTGIALNTEFGIERVRADSNLAQLRREVAATWPLNATTGIGHTRWATHGEVSVANTHPFSGCVDGHFAIALNGIIENFTILREELVARGHEFESTTDAEVVVHLLEELSNVDLAHALALVAGRLEGNFAIVALDERRPGVIAGIRRRVPLVVGLGDGEQFLSSSVEPMLEHTQRFVALDDEVVVILDGENIEFRSLDGSLVDTREFVIDRPTASANHDGFDSFMSKEIADQPHAISETLRGRIVNDRVELEMEPLDASRIERIVIVGCGTALHAAMSARSMFESWAGIHTEVSVASEWRHSEPMITANTLVIAISQSGETADTLSAARLAAASGAMTVAVTNMPDSELTRDVDAVLLTRAGFEKSVAATKTYTAQVTALALLAFDLGRRRGVLSNDAANEILMELELIPAKVASLLTRRGVIASVASRVAESDFVVYLGRLGGMAVALEGALKLREIAYIPCEVYPAGELKHGPIALISSGTPVIAVVTEGTEAPRTISSLHEVRARGAYVIAIATEGDHSIEEVADEVIWVPRTHRMLEAQLSVVPLQQLAHDVAVARGCNVDQPRNLAKTVTVE